VTVLDRLISRLSTLPGVGRKSASRIAYYLLRTDSGFLKELGSDISELKDRIHPCPVCGNFTEVDPCEICSDSGRDRSVICVVEQAQDVHTIDSTNEYRGLFHVLMGVIAPIDGVGPDDLTIPLLMKRIGKGGVREVIVATNPTVEGDATAMYLVRLLQDAGVAVTRPASGLPVGGDLEYADRLTLARSLRSRTRISETR
jgi:recombination protein RecR